MFFTFFVSHSSLLYQIVPSVPKEGARALGKITVKPLTLFVFKCDVQGRKLEGQRKLSLRQVKRERDLCVSRPQEICVCYLLLWSCLEGRACMLKFTVHGVGTCIMKVPSLSLEEVPDSISGKMIITLQYEGTKGLLQAWTPRLRHWWSSLRLNIRHLSC